MKIKKYWFISEFYYPVENSTGHIMTRIIDAFCKENEAHIITVGNLSTKERNQNTHTLRVKDLPSLDKNKFIQRLIKLTLLSIRLAIVILRNVKKGDVVVTVTNPAPLLVFISFIKCFKNVKLIILVHDVFPENLVITGAIKTKSLLYKTTKKIFDFAYNNADKLIVLGRDMQKTVVQKVKNKDKVSFIPNFGDTDLLYPVKKQENSILLNLNITEKIIVFFTGNIGRMQNIDNILQTADLLKDDSSIVFLFIGDGALANKIKEYSALNNNVILLPNMGRKDSLMFLNAGDIALSSLLPNIMGVGVPSKTYAYMATGKPILAAMDSDTEIATMLKEEGNGWIVETNDPNQMAQLIVKIKNNPQEIKEKGDISFNLSKTKYSVEKITNDYVQAITKI